MSRHSESNDLSLQPQSITQYVPSDALMDILRAEGLDPHKIATPTVNHYAKMAWEDLCTWPTKDRKTSVSPVMVVTRITLEPEAAAEYKDYRGVMHMFAVTEDMYERIMLTHAMTYAATGEYLPLTEWSKAQTVPFRCRIGRIETRKEKQYVIRPVPVETEVL